MNYKLSRLADADGDLSKRWYIYYLFRDPETNKWVRFTEWISAKLITRSQRYEQAREKRRRIDLKLRHGYNPFIHQNRGATSIERCTELFLEIKKGEVRSRTLFTYRSHLKYFLAWCDKTKNLRTAAESFTSYMATDMMDWLSITLKPSNRTWNNYRQTMSTFFNFLLHREYVLHNPFTRIHRRETEQPQINAFTRAELDIISNNLPAWNHDLYVIALMIFNCFLRPQEIVRLQVKHLKNHNGFLQIPGYISKNKKNETIGIPAQLSMEISKMDLSYPDNWFVFGLHLKRSMRQIAPTRIAEQWRLFAEKHSITGNIYALKHTGNGMALLSGANARDLQLQNRHSSLDETQKYLERFSRIPSEKFLDNFPLL